MVDEARIERFIKNCVNYNRCWKQIPYNQITDVAIQCCTMIKFANLIMPYINKDMIDVMKELIYPQFDKLEST